jgi:hypothetical protein
MEKGLDKEFEELLEVSLAECTNEGVQRTRRFVEARGIGVLDLVEHFKSVDATNERGVHLLYVLNDVLHHQHRSEQLDSRAEASIQELFEQKWGECPGNRAQLSDLVRVWETRNYLSIGTLRLLRLTAIPIALPNVFGIPGAPNSEQPASLIIPATESGRSSLQPIEGLQLTDSIKDGLRHFYTGLKEEYEFTEEETQPTRTYFGWSKEFEDKYVVEDWLQDPPMPKRYNAFPPPENY